MAQHMATATARAKFLETLRTCGCVTMAARATGNLSRDRWYRERHRNPEFAKEWDRAIHEATPVLVDAAITRAVYGAERTVYHQGVAVGTYREFSDRLLQFLLETLDRERFGPQSKMTHDVAPETLKKAMDGMTPDEVRALLFKAVQEAHG